MERAPVSCVEGNLTQLPHVGGPEVFSEVAVGGRWVESSLWLVTCPPRLGPHWKAPCPLGSSPLGLASFPETLHGTATDGHRGCA